MQQQKVSAQTFSPTSSPTSNPTSNPTSQPTSQPTSSPTLDPNIFNILDDNPDFSTLVKAIEAIEAADLEDVLKSPGPFTVFGTYI